MISTECSSIIGTCDPGSKLLLEEFDITFLFFPHSTLWAYIYLIHNQLLQVLFIWPSNKPSFIYP